MVSGSFLFTVLWQVAKYVYRLVKRELERKRRRRAGLQRAGRRP
ncbi:hypothetical protein [Caproiciproducens sp. NJN-50]|nr:hypothetical protein [Caproiciproducens sp. NJN-50]